MPRFHDKVVVVTGAAHGIGYAVAQRLASEGARVAVADVDSEAAAQAVDDITDAGGHAWAVEWDVCDNDSVAAGTAATVARFGGVDVLVNNVGVAGPAAFVDIDDAEWNRQADPTLRGAMRCVQACAPHLLSTPGGGAVVSVSSVNGMAAVGGVAYSAAKAGLINASQNLAVRYGRRTQNAIDSDRGWIRFNVVSPGTVRTRNWTQRGPEALRHMRRLEQLYPAGRIGEPADIAAAVAFLASPDADWITGVNLPVDGGFLAGPATLTSQSEDWQT